MARNDPKRFVSARTAQWNCEKSKLLPKPNSGHTCSLAAPAALISAANTPSVPISPISALLGLKFVIEVDGSQHLDQQEYDSERTAFLEAQGLYHIAISRMGM